MPDHTLTVCPSCGVVRAQQEERCSHCRAVHGQPLTVVPPDDACWVAVECTFQCRACGFRVPLNHLDMDGAVLCVRCGVEQTFEVVRWREALAHAHAVGDFFQNGGAGFDNPADSIGTSCTGVELTTLGANALAIRASPGHPLCRGCHAPVVVEVTPQGGASVACASCDEQASYGLPPLAHEMTPALRATIASEHRTDRPVVGVLESTGSAAIAITCPSCSAPLTTTEESRFITCAYCKTAARIPDRTWWRVRGGEPTSESMWLLFAGPSPTREEMAETQRRKDAEARQLAYEATDERRAARKREAVAAGLRWEEEQERKRAQERAERRATAHARGELAPEEKQEQERAERRTRALAEKAASDTTAQELPRAARKSFDPTWTITSVVIVAIFALLAAKWLFW